MTKPLPTPHADKLQALLGNRNLPDADKPRVGEAVDRYNHWIEEIKQVKGEGDGLVEPLVDSLNRYRKWLDLDLIFDSSENFLHRQRGQLKLDNSVLEEFLPWLVKRRFADQTADTGLSLGPTNAFSQLSFDSDPLNRTNGGGMTIRSKDHDFAVALPLFLKASHSEDFRDSRQARTNLAYFAVEIKTNLDKTMFQEASATAYDLKLALPSSKYFLLCEWLDMTPISTAVTAIEEVVVLRKAKRLSANIRGNFASARGRAENRVTFERHLDDHPFALDAFRRFLWHLDQLLSSGSGDEQQALERGWF
ncbi:MAG: Bpu10I family restriction endonuclease [Chloroflexi bacterium]|nr:Bpu10I family restriction endonuclease [Chloroflexota bacterium]